MKLSIKSERSVGKAREKSSVIKWELILSKVERSSDGGLGGGVTPYGKWRLKGMGGRGQRKETFADEDGPFDHVISPNDKWSGRVGIRRRNVTECDLSNFQINELKKEKLNFSPG
ncbi:hypothetical protein RUM44_006602 [Polyplax serrata]|uniref:Uncharacterized protein n=1 Tax=Polyplax serrata TaxID=468196 RepID=A0ABR1AIK1_POLSC